MLIFVTFSMDITGGYSYLETLKDLNQTYFDIVYLSTSHLIVFEFKNYIGVCEQKQLYIEVRD